MQRKPHEMAAVSLVQIDMVVEEFEPRKNMSLAWGMLKLDIN